MLDTQSNTLGTSVGLDAITPPAASLPSDSPLLIPFSQPSWSIWKWAAVRGAGFPAELILRVTSPAIAASADQLLTVENRVDQLRRQAIEIVNTEQAQVEPEQRQVLQRTYWKLVKGKTPGPIGFQSASQAIIEQYLTMLDQLKKARDAFQSTYNATHILEHQAIGEIAGIEAVREAITWQNRDAVKKGIAQITKEQLKGPPNAKQRQHEQLLANYLQRYCVKNDSIGFFGPVGWSQMDPSTKSIAFKAGPALLARRQVYFESWGIDSLAEAFASNKELKRWFIPRRIATTDIEGTRLYQGYGRTTHILPIQALVLLACDGVRTAQEIATFLLTQPGKRFRTEKEIYSVLEYLRNKGFIAWTFEVPNSTHPEQLLKQRIAHIPDKQLRQPLEDAIEELEQARQQIATAAGNATQLDQALAHLDETFTRLTDKAPTRLAGQTYAGRTLVYEDCQRDINITLGRDILKELEPGLLLLLKSARWLTYETSLRYRLIFQQIYNSLVTNTGSPVVEAYQFWVSASQFLFEDRKQNTLEELKQLLRKRWQSILKIDPDVHQVSYSSTELSAPVQEQFQAPHAGWKSARFHSPDIMIAARSVEDIQRGNYQFVLGEMHVARNTIDCTLFLNQHPALDELKQARHESERDARIIPVIPKHWQGLTARTIPGLSSPQDWRLVFSNDPIDTQGSRTLPIGTLVIEDTDKGLVVRTRDGQHQFDIMEVFADALSLLIINGFSLLHPTTHTPRVSIDRIVVCRETWRLPLSGMTFAQENDEQARFLAARRWARQHQLPRWVFVKFPNETKPFYIDFDSCTFIDIFSKAIRRLQQHSQDNVTITLSEMLPRHEETWLCDQTGQHFTSELRIVAVDMTRV
ncbi:lantibiotic dehydratase [Dictyobacter kobayashii]|uniref:Lantibiotic dehydratase N-terminal domain-containing protein n=1 Tax=Dictyobacter kobayashii TaxID=2014872 RepID=A0A402ASM9_9CHLR|nr:lantibiotic dehydratase [Dictyobacter kobayashii]GCE22092.1 hypothetical protein KDK_58920 [Dictyobacter kobayashii]